MVKKVSDRNWESKNNLGGVLCTRSLLDIVEGYEQMGDKNHS